MLRIIAGKYRSRRLSQPDERTTRPMPDRIKEAVFSMLGSHYGTPGELPEISVADVFAGSGSMGIEALSRGAVSCVFFERDKQALTVLRDNLDRLEIGPEGTIVGRDAWQAAFADELGSPFDLVFLDPPYQDSRDISREGRVGRYMARLVAESATGPIVALHHDHHQRFDTWPDLPWTILDQRTKGTGSITIYTR